MTEWQGLHSSFSSDHCIQVHREAERGSDTKASLSLFKWIYNSCYKNAIVNRFCVAKNE